MDRWWQSVDGNKLKNSILSEIEADDNWSYGIFYLQAPCDLEKYTKKRVMAMCDSHGAKFFDEMRLVVKAYGMHTKMVDYQGLLFVP